MIEAECNDYHVIASQCAHWRGNPFPFIAVIFLRKCSSSMNYYVYILTNNTGTTMYIGVTKDLVRRMYEHKHKLDPGSFTAKYDIHKLVYYESTSDVRAAIEREKQLKGWNRARKNKLVESRNPHWQDLYPSILP